MDKPSTIRASVGSALVGAANPLKSMVASLSFRRNNNRPEEIGARSMFQPVGTSDGVEKSCRFGLSSSDVAHRVRSRRSAEWIGSDSVSCAVLMENPVARDQARHVRVGDREGFSSP